MPSGQRFVEHAVRGMLINQQVTVDRDTFERAYPISTLHDTHIEAFQTTRSEPWIDWVVTLEGDVYVILKQARKTKRVPEPEPAEKERKNGELF